MALIATISALALVIALTLRDHRLLGGGTVAAVAMWAAVPVVLLVKLEWFGWTTGKALWLSAALFMWAILCGTGRPALLLSTLFMNEPDVPRRLLVRSFAGQGVFLAGITVFAMIDALG